MSRYIDADEFAKQAYEVAYPIVHDINSHERGLTLMGIAQLLDEQPTADVREVVRCKDCKHKPNGYTDDDVLRYPNFPHEENNPCPCQVHEDEWYSWIPNDDFYCSYGEREDK